MKPPESKTKAHNSRTVSDGTEVDCSRASEGRIEATTDEFGVAKALAFGVPAATMIEQQTTPTEDAKNAGKETRKDGATQKGSTRTPACTGQGSVATT